MQRIRKSKRKDGGTVSDKDRIIESLSQVDKAVRSKREQILSDPDDLIDKSAKFLIPAAAGFAVGKIFDILWRKATGKPAKSGKFSNKNSAEKTLLSSMLFAGLSAALGAASNYIFSGLSNKLVNRRHRKNNRRH